MNSSAVMLLYRGGDGGFVAVSVVIGAYTLIDAAATRGLKKQATDQRRDPLHLEEEEKSSVHTPTREPLQACLA